MTNPPHGDPSAQQPYEPTSWTATQQYPPQPYAPYSAPPPTRPRSPGTPWWRRWWAVGIAGLFIGAGIGGAAASGSTNTKTVAGPTVRTTATVTEAGPTDTQYAQVTTTPTKVIATHTATVRVTYTPPPPKSWSDGTYVVGTDIQPGIYKTSGQGDDATIGCYWARLSSLNTQDIIDNGNITGMTTIQVGSGDKALQLSGGCHWSKIG